MDLYRRNGGPPAPLPFSATTESGLPRTDLANHPDVVAELGFVPAPAQPAFDPATQVVVWDAASEAWRVEPRAIDPSPEPTPDPLAGFIPVHVLRQRAEKLGIWDELAAYLGQSPALMLKVTTLENGLVDPAYPDLLKGLDDLGVPEDVRAYLLAPPSFGVPDVPSA